MYQVAHLLANMPPYSCTLRADAVTSRTPSSSKHPVLSELSVFNSGGPQNINAQLIIRRLNALLEHSKIVPVRVHRDAPTYFTLVSRQTAYIASLVKEKEDGDETQRTAKVRKFPINSSISRRPICVDNFG